MENGSADLEKAKKKKKKNKKKIKSNLNEMAREEWKHIPEE